MPNLKASVHKEDTHMCCGKNYNRDIVGKFITVKHHYIIISWLTLSFTAAATWTQPVCWQEARCHLSGETRRVISAELSQNITKGLNLWTDVESYLPGVKFWFSLSFLIYSVCYKYAFCLFTVYYWVTVWKPNQSMSRKGSLNSIWTMCGLFLWD